MTNCKSTVDKPAYPVKTVTIKACGQLYSDWKTRGKRNYKYVPDDSNGITVNMEYADTLGQLDINGNPVASSSRTVLCLHGAPGTHKDFVHQINHLTSLGFRVLAPNFPDYMVTIQSNYLYQHSPSEKKELIKAFLSLINVTCIDLLMCHSSGIYPATNLWLDVDAPRVRSLVLCNPAGHRKLKQMGPKSVLKVAVATYQTKFGRSIFRTIIAPTLKTTGICPLRFDDFDDVALTAAVLLHAKEKSLVPICSELMKQNVPILMVYGEKDPLVEKEISRELAQLLGANDCNTDVYDQDGNQLQASNTMLAKAIVFKTGRHYAFAKYNRVVNHALSAFAEQIY